MICHSQCNFASIVTARMLFGCWFRHILPAPGCMGFFRKEVDLLCLFHSECFKRSNRCHFNVFSSPEPKAHGELIVYRSIRRPSVSASVRPSVNIFKLKYLRNRWANRNQILSEASLGWGIDCIRFWIR